MRRFMKAMLISVCSIAVFMGVNMDAEAQEDCVEADPVQVEYVEEDALQAYADDLTYYGTIQEAGKALREGMKARKGTIEIGFTTTKQIDNSVFNELLKEALKHTGVPTEGDYLGGHYKSYKASAKGSVKNGVYNWVFTFTVKYNTTAAQEKATDKEVDKILSKLNLEGMDTYKKIKTIHDYLCENVSYDWEHVDDTSYNIKHTAYAAAVNKTSVCQGYSLLLYRLLLENGIDVRVMDGTGNGVAHSWDIVEIDGLYYYVDATWNSEYETNLWFLVGSDDFKDHKANEEYTNKVFKNEYPISEKHYWYDGVHDPEFVETVTKSTFSKAGKKEDKCIVCGLVKESKAIAKVSSVKLASTLYTYNGKQKAPAVTVKDKNGKALVKGKDYTVKYASGRKNVGKYSVKITLKGNYSGTKTLVFTIRPKATNVSNITAGSKSFTVKYNKNTTQTTGYQIQYSTSGSFNSAKSVLVKDNKTVSKKISSLKANKKYYVRVRTYKTVTVNGKSTKIYSAWSDKKSVKTKA